MPAAYSPLPNPRVDEDAERELDAAFSSDDDEDGVETTPLTSGNTERSARAPSPPASPHPLPGSYDFEREYDMPPPGSPPRPSSQALPNDIGNSNGLMPTSPVVALQPPRRSFFRRIAGSILPTHYTRVATQPAVVRGGGIENDGVFANVMAKPQTGRIIRNERGEEMYMLPEDIQSQAPPSYSDAQADAVPPYWETTVHAPADVQPGDDMIIDDLPSGSGWVFLVNAFISFFFQFVGFLLTYLLHTSHAAKFGSRAGLGLTMIQFGLYSRALGTDPDEEDETVGSGVPGDPAVVPTDPNEVQVFGSITTRDWLSFVLMTIGWFLLLSSVVGFWRVKRWERSIRSTTEVTPASSDDADVRRNFDSLFGSRRENRTQPVHHVRRDENGHVILIPGREIFEEARLARDLRAAGLL